MEDRISGADLARRSGHLAGVCALAVGVMGAGLLLAWGVEIGSVNLSAGLGLILSAASLAAAGRDTPGPVRARLQRALGAMVLLVGVSVLFLCCAAYALGDEALHLHLLADVRLPGHPGHLGLPAGLGFAVTGLALVLLDRPRNGRAGEAAALAAMLIGALLLLDRAYAVSAAYGLATDWDALVPAGMGFFLSGLGALLARPQRGLMALVLSVGPGGMMARQLLPIALVAPFVVGWLRIEGEHRGMYPSEAAVALVVVFYMVLSAGLILRTASVLRGVYERGKAAERGRRENEQLLRLFAEGAPAGIAMFDRDMNFLAVSRRFLEDYPGDGASVIGRNLYEVYPEIRPAWREMHRRCLAGETLHAEEDSFTRANGSVQWIRWEMSPWFAGTGEIGGVLLFSEEISARKRVETELRAAKAEAERANEAKSRFLAAASHDLRQPLSALTLYAKVLEGHVDPGGAPLLANLNDCLGSLSELLSDLLDLSKLQAGVVTPNPSDFRVADVLASAVSVHEPEARLKGLRLRSVPSGLVGRTDPVLFRRIVGNLVDNAVSYTERGGVLVGCRRRSGKTWVEVWDTGIGIPPDKTAEIFEEFRQLGDDARTRGSGLGLAIVAKTAALLGLEIQVRSRPGRGSVFAIELPLGQAITELPAEPEVVSPRAVRIALVEDNELVLGAMATALRSIGHEVVAAASGEALHAALADRIPDIVVSDYRLAAGETGFDVISTVRAKAGRELPAILVTGDTDPRLVRNMAERGITVLHKPLDMDTLQAYIEDLGCVGPALAR